MGAYVLDVFYIWRHRTIVAVKSIARGCFFNRNGNVIWIKFSSLTAIKVLVQSVMTIQSKWQHVSFIVPDWTPCSHYWPFVSGHRWILPLAVIWHHWNDSQIDNILPKGSYPQCLRMADRSLLAGYPRNVKTTLLNVMAKSLWLYPWNHKYSEILKNFKRGR